MSDVSNSFVERILTELVRVGTGTSKYVNGAITFEMTKLPFAQLVQRFKLDPENPELLKLLPQAAFQDFGERFKGFVQECVDDLRRARGESVPLPTKPVAGNMFNQELYNQFSTILQYTIGRQLDAKQIERLQFDVTRLAEAITKQIEERAVAKAAEICKIVNQITAEGFVTVGNDIDAIKKQLESVAQDARLGAGAAAMLRPIGGAPQVSEEALMGGILEQFAKSLGPTEVVHRTVGE